MTKKKRNWLIALGAMLILIVGVLYYAFVVTSAGNWLLAKFKPDTEEQKLSYSSAIETIEEITDEGFVLMKNEGQFLPIATSAENKTKLNVFGTRSVVTLFNSGGSTATDVTKAVKLEDALRDVGNFDVNPDLLYLNYNFYKSGKVSVKETAAPKNRSDSEILGEANNMILPEVPATAYADSSLYGDGTTLLDQAKAYSDTALVVLGRGGSEDTDLTPEQLSLSEDEAAMMDVVGNNFANVVLVINSANVMQLDFLDDYPAIKSVIWIGYPGETGTRSLAKILNGSVNPSGRLVDTWPTNLMNNPAAINYNALDSNGVMTADSYKYNNIEGDSGYFTYYAEGIYIGYKYYETRHATDSSYNYDEEVLFPFGHGLSYTSFTKDIVDMKEEDGTITLRVSVENTGDTSGKDVIQIYANPAYTGSIEKASVNLVTFKKTNVIEPGAVEYYSLSFNAEDLASYDYKEHKAYVLEAGDYELMLMENAHDKLDSEVYKVRDIIIYNEANDGKRSTDLQVATNQFDDALYADDYLTRDWNSESRAFTGPQESDYTANQSVLDALTSTVPTDSELGLTDADLPEFGKTLDQSMKLAELKEVAYNDPRWDEFLSQLTLDEMANIAGTGAYQLLEIERLGVPKTLQPDGSMAIASNIYSGPIMGIEGVGVTYATPSILAATWNPDAAYLMGTSVGQEAQAFGYSGWFSPAMNIHRTPFNGRNFEYYSEDAVLSGQIAAQVVKAAREKGVITYIKHFAVNDKEKNARKQLFVWSNEQAIREIYLKPFELAVKEGGSLGVMSSFNFIGSSWAGAHHGLLTEVLRNEWGFEGLVITDANMYAHMDTVKMIYAGGDVSLDVMAVWQGGDNHNKIMLAAAKDPATKIGATKSLYQASKNVLFAVSRTWKVTE